MSSTRESIFEICRTRTHKDPGVKLHDLTERVLRDLCPPFDDQRFPQDRIDLLTIALFGSPGTGKTTAAEGLANHFKEVYGDQCNLVGIRGSRLRDLTPKMDARPVQMLVVDDAKAMSRGGFDNIQDINELDDIRHRFKEIRVAAGQPPSGYIVAMHIKQRYADLDVKFRMADIKFFKDPGGSDDSKGMMAEVGPEGYKFLSRIAARVAEKRDQSAKSEMIVRLRWVRSPGRFHLPDKKDPVINWSRLEETGELRKSIEIAPQAIEEENGAFLVKVDPILDAISAEGGDWPLKVQVYKDYQGAASQTTVAGKHGISQASVSNYSSEVKGMISKMLGESYERWAMERWQADLDVDRVERLGGNGEPDLLVYHKDGKVTVVSCKCYNDAKTTSIPIAEIAPEIAKGKELAAAGLLRRVVVDFNNVHKKTRILRAVDPELHDSVITFR